MTTYNAKSVILDIADNHGDASYLGIRSIDFWFESSKITVTSGFTAYATTEYSSTYDVDYAFDTSISKTGTSASRNWSSTLGDEADQRLIIVFDTAKDFDEIRINNSHNSGFQTTRGVNNVEIYISDDAITSTTYGESISNSTLIYDSTFDEHAASDAEDEQTLTLIETGGFPTYEITADETITATIPATALTAAGQIVATPDMVVTAGSSASLSPDDITTGTPVLGSPAIGQTHTLSATGITTGTPTLDSPVLGQAHALTVTGITTGTPDLNSPALGQTQNLTLDDITTGTPVLDSPALGQTHVLSVDGITTGTPVLGSPVLGAGTINGLTLSDIVTGIPVVGTPALGQSHTLTANGITTGTPVLGSPVLGQGVSLTPDGITTGTPVLGSPVIGQTQNLSVDDITAGLPVVDSPAIGQTHVLTAVDIVTGIPVLGSPALDYTIPDTPAIRVYTIEAESRIYNIEVESRVYNIT